MSYTTRSRRLSELVNIGAHTEQLLHEVGIDTQQALRELGPVEAWRRIKSLHPEKATLTCLYTLQGALLAVRWSHLSEKLIEQLLDEAQRDM